MPTRISNAAARASVDALAALLAGGTVQIRTGSQPDGGPDAAAGGTLLATATLGSPAFAAAVDINLGARATANAITGDSAIDADGVAGWFRALTAGGVAVIDGSITATGGGGDMTMADTVLVQNGTFSITAWTITMPEA